MFSGFPYKEQLPIWTLLIQEAAILGFYQANGHEGWMFKKSARWEGNKAGRGPLLSGTHLILRKLGRSR